MRVKERKNGREEEGGSNGKKYGKETQIFLNNFQEPLAGVHRQVAWYKRDAVRSCR